MSICICRSQPDVCASNAAHALVIRHHGIYSLNDPKSTLRRQLSGVPVSYWEHASQSSPGSRTTFTSKLQGGTRQQLAPDSPWQLVGNSDRHNRCLLWPQHLAEGGCRACLRCFSVTGWLDGFSQPLWCHIREVSTVLVPYT